FQAEDGIRDKLVTGVQTCALPIWPFTKDGGSERGGAFSLTPDPLPRGEGARCTCDFAGYVCGRCNSSPLRVPQGRLFESLRVSEIGRASCRERVEGGVVEGAGEKE